MVVSGISQQYSSESQAGEKVTEDPKPAIENANLIILPSRERIKKLGATEICRARTLSILSSDSVSDGVTWMPMRIWQTVLTSIMLPTLGCISSAKTALQSLDLHQKDSAQLSYATS